LAINKRKVLEAARKYAQRGAQAKALKEFEKLLKLDPRDARLRLEVGDAHRRWGNLEKAIETYSKVAEQYTREGFDARAVAVYKQIHNLDPEAYETYEPLADLYQRMGLNAEAILALQTAADGYHKQGRKREALDLLRKMATLDPTNTTSRIKVADLLRQEKLNEEAVAEYEAATVELERQGDRDGVVSVYERILEIEPDRIATVIKLAEILVERGAADRAEPLAKRLLEAQPDEPDRYELLAAVYRLQQRDEELANTYRDLADLYRRRGDEDHARDILQRYVPTDEFDAGLGIDEDTAFGAMGGEFTLGDSATFTSPTDADGNLSLGESGTFSTPLDTGAGASLGGALPPLKGGNELSGDGHAEEYLPLDEEAVSEGGEIPLELDSPAGEVDVPREVTPEAVAPPPPIADPDQVLAEASVYLRYGKRDQAVANLEAIIAQYPDHRAALEKLGEAYADAGQGPKAVATWMRAAECARGAGDAEGVSLLRDRIAALDEAAAATLDVAAAAPAGGPGPGPVPEAVSPAEGEATVLDLSALEGDVSATSAAREIDLDDIEIDIDSSEFAEEIPSDADESSGDEIGLADDATPVEPGGEESEAAASDAAGPGASSSMAQQITEDLEEADFYMKQGLADEAEVIYQRVLSIAPNHPHALVRLGEVAALRGEEPGSTGGAAPPPAEDETAPELGDANDAASADAEEDFDSWSDDIGGPDELDVTSPEADAEAAAPEPDEAVTRVRPETPLEDDLAQQFLAEVSGSEGIEVEEQAEAPPDLEPDVAFEPDIALETDSGAEVANAPEPAPDVRSGDPADSFASPAIDMGEPPDLVAAPAAAEEREPGFDLAAELNDAFDGDANAGTLSGLSDSGDGFEAVFSAFKKGVKKALSESDHEAHFDLGIAYREMGLFEDAKAEFRAAMRNSDRGIECRHMLGLCCFEQEQFEEAIGEFEQIVGSPSANAEQKLTAQFELGRAWEALGEWERARAAYEAVAAVDPSFCDVEARLAALEEPEKPEEEVDELAAEGDGFESFDDLISDGDAGDEVSQAEVDEEPATAEYESFDDFLADEADEDAPWAAAGDAEVAAGPEPEPEAPPAPEPEPPPAPEPEPVPEPPPAPPRRRKRKKISFV
jgi:pilus assembly protein FimV